MSKYIPVIGLEIHVELSTKSKMFCGCPADWFGKEPNIHTCPVCLAMPGALPVPNHQAVEWTILLGQALGCKVNKHSKFDRKHYFYPDLPKGYQISQYDEPIAENGEFTTMSSPTRSGIHTIDSRFRGNDNGEKKIRIRRVHLEEDTGKLMHEAGDTLIDFNRAGVPLVEIVTEPDFDNSDDVKQFLEELQTIVRYLGISDGDLEKGSMRLEPNISLREVTNNKKQDTNEIELPNYKVEVKNINSFRFAKSAIDYELKRHQEILEKGETPAQETRGWDSGNKRTVSQRTKEEAHDYRYFPEPDIPPMEFSDEELVKIKSQMPSLPQEVLNKFVSLYGIKYSDALILTRDKSFSEKVDYVFASSEGIPGQFTASEIVNNRIVVTGSSEEMLTLIKEKYKKKRDSSSFVIDEAVIEKIINNNPDAVSDFKSGKENSLMFLVGQVMKELKGQADATVIHDRLKEVLSK